LFTNKETDEKNALPDNQLPFQADRGICRFKRMAGYHQKPSQKHHQKPGLVGVAPLNPPN